MLNEDQIAQALNAHRIVSMPPINPHGSLGLDHLAEIVGQRLRVGPEPAGPAALPQQALAAK